MSFDLLITVAVAIIVTFVCGIALGYSMGFKALLTDMRREGLIKQVSKKRRVGRPRKVKK